MNNSKKNQYREFCRKEKNIPIFSKDWWLDSVCGEQNWDVIIIEKNNQIVATFPFFIKKKFIWSIITMPVLTQNLGPYFIYPKNQKYQKKLSFEKEVINKIISQLPSFDNLNLSLHNNISNWLPFYWKNFNSNLSYTYVIDNLNNIENVFNNLSPSYRNKIKKAQKIVKVKRGLKISDFYKLNKMTFDRQKIKIRYNLDFLSNHDRVIAENNSREIFYAIDSSEKIHSALYLTWDEQTSYVHLVGEDPNFRNSSAGILLIWEAIKFTRNELKLNNFDFEGSMIEQVEKVRRSFGAKQKPYITLDKCNSKLLKIILSLNK